MERKVKENGGGEEIGENGGNRQFLVIALLTRLRIPVRT
jgi:hypothetical protein